MHDRRNSVLMTLMVAACAGVALPVTIGSSPALAQDKTFVMKMSTATINDTQHEWLKRFAAAVEKDSGGRGGRTHPGALRLGAEPAGEPVQPGRAARFAVPDERPAVARGPAARAGPFPR